MTPPDRPGAAAVGPWPGEARESLRFVQLFVFTVLVFVLVPLQIQFRALWLVLSVLYLNAIVVALTTGRLRRRARWGLLGVWLLAQVVRLVPVADPDVARLLYVTSRMLVVVLLFWCVGVALYYVLRGTAVSVDRIFAAIVAYMLAGLGFAAAYQGIMAVAPESFALPAATGGNELERVEVQLIYFSFVTIATLGYGDITPRLPLAQMLVVLEAVTGQFYVAVIIAWLVSVHAGRGRSA